MTNTTQKIEVFCGDYKEIPITILNEDGTPVNLTALSLSFTVYKQVDCPEDLNDIIFTNVPVIISAVDGTALITISAIESTQVPATYIYKLKLIDVANKKTLIKNYFVVEC